MSRTGHLAIHAKLQRKIPNGTGLVENKLNVESNTGQRGRGASSVCTASPSPRTYILPTVVRSGSLGRDASGIGIEELLVKRREEHADRLRMRVLEGLKLFGVQGAERRQRRDPAHQLRVGGKKGGVRHGGWTNGRGAVGFDLPWSARPRPCGSSA